MFPDSSPESRKQRLDSIFAGAIVVADALTKNSTLTALGLRGNAIRMAGMAALSQALRVPPLHTAPAVHQYWFAGSTSPR